MKLGDVIEMHALLIQSFRKPLGIEGLELSSAKFQGGFGSVHTVIGDSAAMYEGILVKIITGEHAAGAFRTIVKLYDKLEALTSQSWRFLPGLTAFPFQAYRCRLDEQIVTVFLMKDLDHLSFDDFGSDDFDELAYIQDVEFDVKVRYAKNLADVLALFESVEFCHADLKEKSLFVSPAYKLLSLIDFDGGFHLSDSKQGTIGSITRYAGAKVLNWLLNKKSAADLSLTERVQEDRWKTASALFHLVTGMTPFFFFRAIDEQSFKEYSQNYRWPEVDFTDELFNPDASAMYNYLKQWWQWSQEQKAFGPFRALCLRTFGKGLVQEKYPEAHEWQSVMNTLIRELNIQPEVKAFNLNKDVIERKGESVEIEIDCAGVDYYEIDGEPFTYFTHKITRKLNDSHNFEARFVLSPNQLVLTKEVKANKTLPLIRSFSASKNIRDSYEPVIISWDVDHVLELEIRGVKSRLEPKGEIEIEPNGWTKYIISAKGFFDQIVERAIEVDVVHPRIISLTSKINLEKGYRNVDIRWEVEHAESVSIQGIGEKLKTHGIAHIDVIEPIRLKVRVKGYFGQEVEESILVEPFPQPIIRSMLIPTPDFSNSWKIEIPNFYASIRAVDFGVEQIPEISFAAPIIPLFSVNVESFHLVQPSQFEFNDKKTYQTKNDENQ